MIYSLFFTTTLGRYRGDITQVDKTSSAFLTGLRFCPEEKAPKENSFSSDLPAPVQKTAFLLATELTSYSEQKTRCFTVPYLLLGSPFERQVWQTLVLLPYGHTASYLDIARKLGYPQAVRAVGRAIGKNPLELIIPCRRVIRHNGALGGYRSGLTQKEKLLFLEGNPAFCQHTF